MSSNLEMIQKLSLGKDDIEKVTLELEDDLKADFTLRPLTSGEISKLKALEKKSVVVKIGMEAGKRKKTTVDNSQDINVNTGEFTEDQAEAMYKAIALSLSVDDEDIITADDVKKMRVGLPELLFTEVIRISQLTEDDLSAIKSFQ